MNKAYGFLIKKDFKILNFINTNDINKIKVEQVMMHISEILAAYIIEQ